MVTILRIGHRIERDKRITTHLALVARSLGAERIVIAGEKDEKLEETLFNVVSEWGGIFQFEIIPYENWEPFLRLWKSNETNRIVHLTMYGENLSIFEKSEDFFNLKKRPQNLSGLLVIVGGKKIPGKVFHYADWNIAITNQPHSEVGSLAVFLDHLISNALEKKYSNAKKQIIPSLKGKKQFSK